MYPPRPFFPVAAEEELVPESRKLLAAAASLLLLVVEVSIWLEAEEDVTVEDGCYVWGLTYPRKSWHRVFSLVTFINRT